MLSVAIVDREQVGMRLDLFLTHRFSGSLETAGLSRTTVQKMIAGGQITLNGQQTKPGVRLRARDLIEIQWLPPADAALSPEPLPLDVLYEDQDCIVVNKAPGMVVHPAAGRRTGTLVNALLHHCPNLQGIGGERRPGIVHRLDKDTSGVMVIAKRGMAFQRLALQFKERRVRKEYLALVWGRVDKERGVINRPIGRHRRDRKKMSSISSLPKAREAITEWRVEQAFRVGASGNLFSWVTLLRLVPRSGRTHQIRVHLADQGYPLVGDKVYGGRCGGLARKEEALQGLIDFPRQALHGERLRFTHPRTGRIIEFKAPLPADMAQLVAWLKERQSSS